MKKTSIILAFTLLAFCGYSQKISTVSNELKVSSELKVNFILYNSEWFYFNSDATNDRIAHRNGLIANGWTVVSEVNRTTQFCAECPDMYGWKITYCCQAVPPEDKTVPIKK